MSVAGRTVVLTAALSDVGQGCARYLAQHGATIVVVDNDQSAIDTLCVKIRADGGNASAVRANLTDVDELSTAATACGNAIGSVDVLVTCPSDVDFTSIEESSIESWRRVIENNLLGPVIAAKAFLPFLKRAQNAAIIHFGSIDGILGNPQLPSYSAAKGGIVALTHVMADEFGSYGIRVNCVARAMTVERGGEVPEIFKQTILQTPLGRSGYLDEVGAAVKFLASTDSSYITGAVLPVDGGRSAITPGTRRNAGIMSRPH